MTDSIRSQVNEKVREMAKRPLRCLALAYKEGETLDNELATACTVQQAASLPQLANSTAFIDLESDLVLVGICGIKDPARPEAAEAIQRCKEAGVRVMMMTGDSKDTAVAIARDVNILTSEEAESGSNAFTGQEFFSLPAHVQLELLHTGNMVFCRTEPQDKQRLISMLKKLNEIVAMTGDGVNDAPALQQADIGIAMGRTGTEVAKSAADMVLSDDNFVSIVNGVEEGRNIFANMQTFVCFLISCNIGEIATIFFATLLGLPEPLTALHLLWINLVTDGPPATALGFNPPDAGVMKKKPRPAGESIMSPWLLTRYIITGTYVGFATVGAFVWWFLDKGVSFHQLLKWGKCSETNADFDIFPEGVISTCELFQRAHLATPQSVSLSVLVTMEMLKALSAVSLNSSLLQLPPWKNPWLLLGVAVPFLLHIAVLYVRPFAQLFGLAPLSAKEWQVSLLKSIAHLS
jgi:Ca2+-transporting ATPase